MTERERAGLEVRFRFNTEEERDQFLAHSLAMIAAEDERPEMMVASEDCIDSGDEEFYSYSETQFFFPNRIRETVHHYWRRTIQCPNKPPKTRTWRTKDVTWHQIDNWNTPPG